MNPNINKTPVVTETESRAMRRRYAITTPETKISDTTSPPPSVVSLTGGTPDTFHDSELRQFVNSALDQAMSKGERGYYQLLQHRKEDYDVELSKQATKAQVLQKDVLTRHALWYKSNPSANADQVANNLTSMLNEATDAHGITIDRVRDTLYDTSYLEAARLAAKDDAYKKFQMGLSTALEGTVDQSHEAVRRVANPSFNSYGMYNNKGLHQTSLRRLNNATLQVTQTMNHDETQSYLRSIGARLAEDGLVGELYALSDVDVADSDTTTRLRQLALQSATSLTAASGSAKSGITSNVALNIRNNRGNEPTAKEYQLYLQDPDSAAQLLVTSAKLKSKLVRKVVEGFTQGDMIDPTTGNVTIPYQNFLMFLERYDLTGGKVPLTDLKRSLTEDQFDQLMIMYSLRDSGLDIGLGNRPDPNKLQQFISQFRDPEQRKKDWADVGYIAKSKIADGIGVKSNNKEASEIQRALMKTILIANKKNPVQVNALEYSNDYINKHYDTSDLEEPSGFLDMFTTHHKFILSKPKSNVVKMSMNQILKPEQMEHIPSLMNDVVKEMFLNTTDFRSINRLREHAIKTNQMDMMDHPTDYFSVDIIPYDYGKPNEKETNRGYSLVLTPTQLGMEFGAPIVLPITALLSSAFKSRALRKKWLSDDMQNYHDFNTKLFVNGKHVNATAYTPKGINQLTDIYERSRQ